jgi:hypothetical protein
MLKRREREQNIKISLNFPKFLNIINSKSC